MERLPPHGGSRGSSSEAITLVYLPATSAAPPQPASEPSGRFGHERGSDTIKAQIMSHPRYPALLRAFIDCQKVGAPPEDVGRLSTLARELEPCPDGRREQPSDPELDQFMEAYCDVLVKYREELTRPIQEADEFCRSVEAQLHSFGLDNEKCEGGGGGSSDEDEEAEMEFFPEVVVSGGTTEDTELKSQLLNKYSGYLSSLWKELSKKKKKGKLPRDARQKLLHWWHLHYRWPYPSEKEKAALAESTGLDAKQINNWFINQRKRHWKPTAGVDRLHPAAGAASTSSSAALCMGGQYCFLGESTYPRGP